MRALKVDFAPSRRLPAWACYGVSAGLLALAAQQGWQAWGSYQRARVLERERAEVALEGEQAERAQREAQARALLPPPYAQDALAAAKVAGFALNAVFRSIEAVRIVGIKVTAIEISAVDGTARLEVGFGDHATLLRYVEELNAGEPKRRWSLVQAHGPTSTATAATATIVGAWSD